MWNNAKNSAQLCPQGRKSLRRAVFAEAYRVELIKLGDHQSKNIKNIMKTNKILGFAIGILVGAITIEGNGQSAYSNAIVSLNPVGYWPMHEVAPPANGDIETNYGTLGLLGTGYYPDWAVGGPVTSIKRGITGAIGGDPGDTAVNFTRGGNPAAATYTNFLYVPHSSPLTTLRPPFSVECWFFPTNLASDDIWAQCGDEGLNRGAAGGNIGSLAGIRLVWMNGTNTGFQIFNLNGVQNSAGFVGNLSNPEIYPTNIWYHLVVTCDASTNISLYVNGNLQSFNPGLTGSVSNGPGSYTPDYWTPITIGGGRGGTRAVAGYVDEFAVYTNVLGDVSTHYNDGISGAAGAYFHDVINDKAAVYLRMDAPATYTPPNVSTWPVVLNYGITNGVAVGNGLYSPGTVPGAVTTRIANPSGIAFGGVSGNQAALSGISSFADAGNAPAYNPTGSNVNFTVTALFRGNPCDNRIQSIVGHGTNSWQLSITTNGCIVFNAGNARKAAGGTGQAAGDITSTGSYNDGIWHQVAAVTATNVVSIYVDGVLNTNGVPNGISVTNIIPGNASDVLIGSDPTYTNNPAGAGRSFAGQICDVALFNQSLTAGQIQTLYSNCIVAPFISGQPVSGRAIDGGQGTSILFGVLASGSPSLAYQWYFNTTSNYSGATQLVDGAKYTGSATLQVTVTNLVAADSGYYFATITNNYGSVTSSLASLTVFGAPALTSELPITYSNSLNTNFLSLYAGANPTFSVSANGAQPISYFWYTNGVLDPIATNSSFTWTNIRTGSMSSFCVLTNVAGVTTSELWTATVIAAPNAPYPTNVLADNPIGYWRLNEPDDGQSDGDPGLLALDYAGGNNGIYTNVILSQSGYSSTDPSDTSAAFGEFGSLPAINNLAGQIRGVDFAMTNGGNSEFTVEAWANGINNGLFPQASGAPLAAKGEFGVDDQFNLGIDTTKLHYRFYVRSANGTVYTVGSGSSPALDNNWHHIVGVCDEANGQLLLYFDGQLVNTASIPTNSGIFEDSEPITFGAGTSDDVNYTNQFVGTINDVAVYNYALGIGQVTAQYSSVASSGIPPYFTQTPPASMTLNAGGTLATSAAAAGTTPIGYYWTDINSGTNVAAGVTNGLPINTAVTVSNVPFAWNNDQLKLTVTNAYGSVSASVKLTILGPPEIIDDLPPQIALPSGSYTYSIGIIGISPFSYQWYGGGVALANQTNATYTATVGSQGSSTTYYVVVTNVYGAVTSLVSTFKTATPLTNAYAAGILQFHPAGYWPMHEAEAPAPGDIETNYGTLGLLGTGYYPDWVANYGGILRQQAGALAGDSDLGVRFTHGTGNSGTTVSFTNGLYIPLTSPLTTLNPPFSVECWFFPVDAPTGEAIWAQTGAVGLNDGALGSQNNYNGIMLNWANGTFVPYGFNGQSGGITANNGAKLESGGVAGGSPVEPVNNWYQVVVTCDASTNFTLYVNGVSVAGPTSDVGKYVPDSWTPISIGSGNGGIRSSSGGVDEFAIYPTNLSLAQITNHYSAGTNSTVSYFQVVTNDNPVIYLRMDSLTYTQPAGNWPPLVNYGSAPVNGFYSPGTMPGIVPGPRTNGVPFGGLSGTSVAQLSGVSSYADVGYDTAFNPTGSSQTLSVTAWFRGNPADGRFQNIIGHSDSSWRVALNTSGKLQFTVGSDTALTSTGVYNDGNWHQFVAVYDGAGGNEYLYVDGVLDNSTAVTGSSIAGSTADVFIGSDPQYTNNPVGVGRQFAGQVCEAAYFNTALTSAQAMDIYNETIAPPVNATPTNIVFTVTGNQLTLSWPADHTGWRLQAQTNSLNVGITTNWANVNGSSTTNQIVVPINLTNGSVFYRLVYP